MSKDIYKKLFLYLSTFIMILTLPGLKYVFGDNDHTGWHKENGLTYYYLSNGKKATGLVNIKMDSYYFMKKDHKVLKKGAMVYGWKNIGKYYYFFNRQSGAMVKGEYIDGVYLRDNGKAKLKSGDKKIIDQFINARKEVLKITDATDTKTAKKKKCSEYIEDVENLKIVLNDLSIVYKENSLEDEKEMKDLSQKALSFLLTESGYDKDSYVFTNKKSAKVSKPRIKKPVLFENGDIKVKWTKSKEADYYLLYRKAALDSGFKLISKTVKRGYRDKNTKAGKKYFYRVVAVKKETHITKRSISKFSNTKKIRARRKPGRIAFLGDSVMSGFGIYVNLGANTKSFAEIGLSVLTLNNSRMSDPLTYNADRVFIMIGTNDCVGNRSDSAIENDMDAYISVCKKLHNKNKNVEIIAMGIGPTNSDRVPMDNVNRYNSALKRRVSGMSYVKFFDTAKYLKNSSGKLDGQYSGADGIHWSVSAYNLIYDKLQSFVKKW